jgi:hypothetical protein
MIAAEEKEQPTTPNGLGRLLLILILLIPAGMVLGWLDNTTQISPDTGNLILASFVMAAVGGLISGGMAIYLSKDISFGTRIRWVIPLLMIGAIGPFLVTSHATAIVSGWINFPPSMTKSSTELISITRAYQTHGKGGGAHIQTAPVWTDLNITKSDYQFMQEHRRPGDAGTNPDEISSRGYFCAQVVIQRAGNAVRIMHAGDSNLPKGSVIVCPLIGPMPATD